MIGTTLTYSCESNFRWKVIFQGKYIKSDILNNEIIFQLIKFKKKMINFHHTKHYLKIIILRYYLLNARIEKEIENMGINLDNVSKINYILLVSLRNLGLMILLKKKKKGERERLTARSRRSNFL